MKILMIADYADPLKIPGEGAIGGIGAYVSSIGRFLSEQKNKIDIYARCNSQAEIKIVTINKYLRIIRIFVDAPDREQKHYRQVAKSFELGIKEFIRENNLQYDLIHSNNWLAGLVGLKLACQYSLPQTHVFHSLGVNKQFAIKQYHSAEKDEVLSSRIREERKLCKQCEAIVVTNSNEREVLVKEYDAAPERLKLIPLGVDLKKFRYLDQRWAKRVLGFSKTDKIVLYVGRMSYRKGPTILLEAFSLIAAKNLQLKLIFVGGDKKDSNGDILQLKKRVAELHLTDQVKFVPSVSHNRLYLYYNAAEVTAIPSLHENFCFVTIESMACGTPVVASDVGGLKFTVIEPSTGYRFPVADSIALAKKIEKVFQHGKAFYRDNCLNRVTRYFDWKDLVFSYSRFFQEIISRYQQAKPRKKASLRSKFRFTF